MLRRSVFAHIYNTSYSEHTLRIFFFVPSLDSVICPTSPHPQPRLYMFRAESRMSGCPSNLYNARVAILVSIFFRVLYGARHQLHAGRERIRRAQHVGAERPQPMPSPADAAQSSTFFVCRESARGALFVLPSPFFPAEYLSFLRVLGARFVCFVLADGSARRRRSRDTGDQCRSEWSDQRGPETVREDGIWRDLLLVG